MSTEHQNDDDADHIGHIIERTLPSKPATPPPEKDKDRGAAEDKPLPDGSRSTP